MNSDAALSSTYHRQGLAKRFLIVAVLAVVLLYSTFAFSQIIGTGQLNIERRGHSATLLEDGKVLIVGGDNQNGAVSQAEVFDPASQTSALAATSITPRTDHSATRLSNGRVLVIGGRDQSASLQSTEIYDPVTLSFVAGPSMMRARSGHTATILSDGKILVAGGDLFASAEIYDPVTESFSLASESLNTARKFHSAILTSSGQVMIVGGVNAQGAMLNTAEVFDPASQSFYMPPTDMQTARAFATLKLLPDGKVQIIGGDAELSMEVFDPADGIFIAKALLPPNVDLLDATLSTQSRAALFSPSISQDPLLQGVLTSEQLALLDRADQSITELPSRNQALVAGGINSTGQILNSAKLVNSSSASVTTDKTDYAPGQIVTITGSGFQPNEQVDIYFHEFPEEYPDIFFSVVANQQGDFVTAEFAPQEIDLGRIFTLTAIGQTSGFTAQTAFKDNHSITVSCSPGSVSTGSPATCTGTIGGGTTGQPASGRTVSFTTNGPGGFSSTTCVTSGANMTASCSVNYTPSAVGTGTHRITGSSGTGGHANSNFFDITVTAAGTAPTITSANSTTFTVGTAGSFTVTTTGSPMPALMQIGMLPLGVTFTDNGNGIATLSGTPALATVSSYTITITANNGVSPNATQNFTLTVQKAEQATLTINAPATMMYGSSATLTASGGSGTGAVTFSVGDSTGCAVASDQLSVTNASGNCLVTAAKAADDNYNMAVSVAATVTLVKADATVNVVGFTGVYDGSPHGASGTATGVGGADLSASLSLGATFTNVPGGTANWTFTGGTNYNDANGSVPIVINKADATINVVGFTGVYDGSPHGASGTATGVGGADLSASLSLGATFTNVPGGTANWTFTGGTNYNDANGSVPIVINKADATINVVGFTGVYDGSPHGASGTATGVGGVDLSASLSLGATFTNVPGGTANWTFTGGTNYNDANGSVPIVINKADATINVVGFTGVYDGSPHGASGTATGVGGADLSASLSLGATFTNVPGGTANWTFTGGTNYNDANGSVPIVINKADATINVVGFTGVYDGSPHGASGTATGVGGADLSASLSLGATFTNVPGGTANWTFTGGTNYNDANGSVPIVINKADATINVVGFTGVYDGSPHGASGTATGVGGADLSASLSLGATFTNVPGGTANWTFTGGTNYNDANGSVPIVINKRAITVTATTQSKTYGDPDPMLTFTVGGSGLAAGDTISSVFSGALVRASGTTVAGSPYQISQGMLVANSNYNITSFTPSALTILPKALVGSITVYSKQYDGNNTATIATRTLSGVVSGDDVSYVGGTATFDNPLAGTNKLVTATGLYLSGADAGNYTVNDTATTYADIYALGFEGFLAPVGGADLTGGTFANPLRTIKLGSTLPVKFKAFTNGGTPWLTGIHTIHAIKYSDATTWEPALEVTATDAATTGNHRFGTDLKTRLVEGELVVLDREGQMVHQLNRTASYIWQHCDGESSAARIAGEVCHDFEVDYSTALQDVLNTIEQLEKMKLLKDR
jgi:hypothetical protein